MECGGCETKSPQNVVIKVEAKNEKIGFLLIQYEIQFYTAIVIKLQETLQWLK